MIRKDNNTRYRSLWVGGWLTLSVLLHAVWFILFVWVLWFGPFDQILPRPEWLERCSFCENSADAISTAGQMGRLDVVSLALTILGVVIGVAALGSYALIRQAAMSAAQNEAYDWMEANFAKLIPNDYVKDLTTDERLISTLVRVIQGRIYEERNTVSSSDADNIATSMEEPK